jgi:hypothetical protein
MSDAPQDPFFIVGAPRSGTTLLQAMLNAHSRIIVAPETDFMRRYWRYRRRYGPLTHAHRFEQLLEMMHRQPEFADFDMTPEQFLVRAAEYPRSWSGALMALLDAYRLAHKPSATHIGEKSPAHSLFIPALAALFPNTRFIHIVRDPRAVVESLRRMPWGPRTISGAAFLWRDHVDSIARSAKRLRENRLCEIRYEDLIAAPQPTLARVCGVLGLEFERAMLNHAEHTLGFDAAREPWKAAVLSPVRAELRDRWRDMLTGRQLLVAEACAGRAMVRWGYRRSPSMADVAGMLAGLYYRSTRLTDLISRKMRAVRGRFRSRAGSARLGEERNDVC